jgi:hypothetical protein
MARRTGVVCGYKEHRERRKAVNVVTKIPPFYNPRKSKQFED